MKTRIITAIVGILVLIGVLFTFDTLVFNFVIAAITLIAIHEIFKALGFGRKEWPMYAVFVPYPLLIMLSSYQVWRRLVMPASFLMVLFFGIYLVVRNAQVDFAKASGLVMFSGIVIFCFYSFIRLKELLPAPTLQAEPLASTNSAPWSAPKRPWREPLAACWAPWCSA